MAYAVFAAGGAEAVDVALKSARYATQRRKIVSIIKGYHGHAGLVGRHRRRALLQDLPLRSAGRVHPGAVQRSRRHGGGARGPRRRRRRSSRPSPRPTASRCRRPGYLPAVKALCEKYGALYIADEVQTGLMRCGEMWGWQAFGVQPDMFVTAKGLGGGLYPIAVCLLGERAGGWMNEDGAAHISTTGGGEVGCFVGAQGAGDPAAPGDARQRAARSPSSSPTGFAELMRRTRTSSSACGRRATVMGVEFDHPEGAVAASRGALRERRLGDLLLARQARAAVQARRADVAGALRGGARPLRCGDAAHPRAERRPRRPRAMTSARAGAALRGRPRSAPMLERARWAAAAFADLDRPTTLRIARAVADAGFAKARTMPSGRCARPASASSSTSGSRTSCARAASTSPTPAQDFVGPAIDAERKIVRVARPAGVIFALTPSTNPISTVFFKTVLALLTRNAIVISPHPLRQGLLRRCRRRLAAAAPRRRRAGRRDPGGARADHPADRAG